ncbi:hypothetical protein E3O51_06120 [Cryobacterium sp. MDB2-10]|nr:hypothetical protein E3O51_06120 [Cryobacterium sp. MDB2-10]
MSNRIREMRGCSDGSRVRRRGGSVPECISRHADLVPCRACPFRYRTPVRIGKATMSELTAVELLHADYAQVHSQHPATLTGDQVRSLRIYAAELRSRTGIDPADSDPGIVEWLRIVAALEAFAMKENRMARENRRLAPGAISAEERTLVNKLRGQRRAFKAGRLCEYQIRRLECIPGLSLDPRGQHWDTSYRAYARFIEAHQDTPKARSKVASERSLAQWAAKARMAYRAGTLSQDRIDACANLDRWTWGGAPRR